MDANARNLRPAGSKRGHTLRVQFTRARLDNVTVPAGKDRVWVRDAGCPGLMYMKSSTGLAKFYFYKKVNGQPRKYPIADGHITIDDARKLVRKELTEYAHGHDAKARRQATREMPTLTELFANWKAIEGGKIRSAAHYEYLFNTYAKPLHGRKINEIRQHDIAKLHADIPARIKAEDDTKTGRYAANRCLAVLSLLFRWASRQYGIDNPTAGVKKYPEESRERFLQPAELVKFMDAIDGDPDPTWRDFWRLLLATGARRGNVAAMKWADVDLHAKAWRIPASSAKGKRALTVPLSPEAADILQARKDARESLEWVFPSFSLKGHLVDPKAAWGRLLARAGLSGLRMHDIRRSVGSYLAMSGASLPIIGAALGHRSQASTAVYARLMTAPVRDAMATGAATMEAARAAALAEIEKQQGGKSADAAKGA